MQTPPYNTNGGGDSASQSSPGMNMVTAGTVIATVKWVPIAGQNDPPPPTLTLKQTAFARWHTNWGGPFPDPLPGGGLADDGLGDPDKNGLSSGSHLIKVDSSSGIVRLPCTMQATCPPAEWATITPYPDYPQYSQSYWTWYPDDVVVSYNVVRDNREVWITSQSIETSYFKTDDEHGGSPYQTSHQRNPDGSIVTDSAVSPPLNQPGGATTWKSSPILMAQAPNFQNPTFAWSLTGDGSLPTAGNSSQTELSVSFPPDPAATTLNKQSIVRLDVQDSDFATAANTFTVRWHYPKEGFVLIASGMPFWQPAELKAHGVAFKGGTAQGTFGYSTYADFFPAASGGIFVAANGAPNEWSPFVAAIGLLASQVQPTETNSRLRLTVEQRSTLAGMSHYLVDCQHHATTHS